jgi:hypothetical protein
MGTLLMVGVSGGVGGVEDGRQGKEGCSFLKKRTKKLLPRAQRGFATTCFARVAPSAAGITTLECLRRWELVSIPVPRAKHVVAKPRCAPGKVFCFFFSKKKAFLPLP